MSIFAICTRKSFGRAGADNYIRAASKKRAGGGRDGGRYE